MEYGINIRATYNEKTRIFFLVMHTQWVSVVYQVYPMMKVHDMGKIHHGIVAKNVEFFVAKTGCHVYHPPVITIFWLVVWLSFPGKWVVTIHGIVLPTLYEFTTVPSPAIAHGNASVQRGLM